jgi:hypothetical protein
LPVALRVCAAAEGSAASPVPTSIRTLDFRSLPGDAFEHARTKWSKDVFILIDDDRGAPSLYMFDRAGHIKFDGMIQIAGAVNVRVTDFASAGDGSVWTCGYADSATAQRSFFLAHLTDDGQGAQIIRTNPYAPWYLTVAPDGTLWTVGYGLGSDDAVDLTLDSLRHFDSSGKLIRAAIPTDSVGIIRAKLGYLDSYQGRLGWYSPTTGIQKRADGSPFPEAYLEVSANDATVVHSIPALPRNRGDYPSGFAITPSGRVFVEMYHSGGHTTLHELDRGGNRWVSVDGPRNRDGEISRLQGNDGESLVFSDTLAAKSQLTLQIVDLSQTVTH